MSLKRMVAYEDGDLEIARENGFRSFYTQYVLSKRKLETLDICPYAFPAFQYAWWMGFLNASLLFQRKIIKSFPWDKLQMEYFLEIYKKYQHDDWTVIEECENND